MIWQDKNLTTMGDVINAISSCVTKQEAEEFLHLYGMETGIDVAKHNIGYATGYMDRTEADRLMALFDCPHPLFGFEHPTPEDALAMGISMGQLSKQYGSRKALEMLSLAPKDPWYVGALDKFK